MNILIVGSGGREHALSWKCAQSEKVSRIYVAPGNAGIALEPKVENIDIKAEDIEGLVDFAANKAIDLTIIGPEAPLVAGIVDRFQSEGLKCFGPSMAAAQLEGSKAFAKAFLQKYEIPTAQYQAFTQIGEALAYLQAVSFPVVIKADGLAAGKGVVIADTLEEAEQSVTDMLDGNRFGEAGHRVVIESFLTGEEASFIVMVDGENVLPMASSQDHKAAHDGDIGPNTGGMGAYSPAPVVSESVHNDVMQKVIMPTVRGMAKEGHPYTGFLYAGLMIDHDGTPNVVEFNCRFGDPEAQPVLMRLQSDLVEHILHAIDGTLDQSETCWDERVALGVVMAAEGYPDSYEKGHVINGLPDGETENTKVFHAGTTTDLNQSNAIVTSGGRVLCVSALGDDIKDAQQKSYDAVSQINWQGSWYRTDIGHRAIARKS